VTLEATQTLTQTAPACASLGVVAAGRLLLPVKNDKNNLSSKLHDRVILLPLRVAVSASLSHRQPIFTTGAIHLPIVPLVLFGVIHLSLPHSQVHLQLLDSDLDYWDCYMKENLRA
jgi:hypothetical protein